MDGTILLYQFPSKVSGNIFSVKEETPYLFISSSKAIIVLSFFAFYFEGIQEEMI
jgi:hypothetical protein